MRQTADLGASLVLEVNGEQREAPVGCTIEGLLASLELTGRRVAVAVDRNVVPRSQHAAVTLRGGERVEILEAVGGG